MSAEGGAEKTEAPTPKRLADARKKGIVAKSTDLVGALVLLTVLAVAPSAFQQFGFGVAQAFQRAATDAPRRVASTDILHATGTLLIPGLQAMGVVIAAAMAVGLAANFAQVGFHLSGEALNPSLEKINPLAGAKRIFSKKALFEGLKAAAKGLLFGFIAWTAIRDSAPKLLMLTWQTPAVTAKEVGAMVVGIGFRVASAWLALAVVDYIVQRKQTMKQLMMTKDELKREYKEQEGSPEIKSARMQRMRRLSKGRMAEAVRKADAIITNPTHYAIAIKYERDKMAAPVVVAKGVDYLALKIREIAGEAQVPIVPNPPLARALYKHCEVGDYIPREHFAAVAEVLAYVYKTIKGMK